MSRGLVPGDRWYAAAESPVHSSECSTSIMNKFWNKLQWSHRVFCPRRARRSRHRLHSVAVELLERRTLLTGNVTAAFSHGDLVLRGDDADNSVAILNDGGNLVVRGSSETTINGSSADFVAIVGATNIHDDLWIDLRGGNDTLSLQDVQVGDDVRMRSGSGNDTLSLQDVQVGDDVRMRSGSGNDNIAMADSQIGDDLRIDTSDGNDTVVVLNLNVSDDTHISTGSDSDLVRVSASSVDDDLRIRSASGDDAIIVIACEIGDDHTIHSGSDDDTINVASTNVSDDLQVSTSSGRDALVFDQIAVSDDSKIRSGTGDDSVVVKDSQLADDLSVSTSGGDDFVFIDPTVVGDDVKVKTGNENDTIVLSGANVFSDRTRIFGGSGTNLVDVDASNQFASDPRLSGVSGNSVDSATIDTLLNDPNDGALSRVTAASNGIDSATGPMAVDDVFTTSESILNVDAASGLTSNDQQSVFGGALTAALGTSPANGSVTVNADGSFSYQAAAEFSGTDTFTYQVSDVFGSRSTGNVQITVDQLELTLDLSNNTTVQSSGTLLTGNAMFQIDGTTAANGVIDIDSDNDGSFNDASTTADSNGDFSTNVTLTHDAVNNGAHLVRVRVRSGGLEQTESFSAHYAVGTVVRFASSIGSFDTELLDVDAPQTVTAFLSDLTRYDTSFIHRSIDDFMIQGGGFTVVDSGGTTVVDTVEPFTAPPNEFLPENSNVRGTLSTAQIGGNVNSFTGQYFVNTVDNLHLDSVPHTVFGRVVGTGMDVVDTINGLTTFNLVAEFGESALTTVPLQNYNNAVPPEVANFIVTSSISALPL